MNCIASAAPWCARLFRNLLIRAPRARHGRMVDKLLSSDELTAEQIAGMVKQAVARQQFLLIPTKPPARLVYQTFCACPVPTGDA